MGDGRYPPIRDIIEFNLFPRRSGLYVGRPVISLLEHDGEPQISENLPRRICIVSIAG